MSNMAAVVAPSHGMHQKAASFACRRAARAGAGHVGGAALARARILPSPASWYTRIRERNETSPWAAARAAWRALARLHACLPAMVE